ncbi:MAG: Eco57I restriction-modification methylase domain-containing protein, partial [bacterium]|nr:Eco57I restriction-modification methylase domain-containing protein [bacterium]
RYIENSNQYTTLFQKWDLYVAFIEKGLRLLKNETGRFSMIIPYPYINQMYAQKSREYISDNFTILNIVDLSEWKIFQDAVVRNCIIVVQKRNPKNNKVNLIKKDDQDNFSVSLAIPQKDLIQGRISVWNIENKKLMIFEDKKYMQLGDCCFISIGMVLNADEFKAKGLFKKKDLISDVPSKIHIKKYIEGKDIDRYLILGYSWLEWGTKRVPYLIRRPTFPELYECPKILVNKLGKIKATMDYDNLYCEQTVRIVVLFKYLRNVENKSILTSIQKYCRFDRKTLEDNSEKLNYKYLLGFLNSKLATYLFDQIRGRDNIDINPDYLKQLPIRLINFSNPAEKKLHDNLVGLVEIMLDLNQKLPNAKGAEKERLQSQIAQTDREIDNLVYTLYGLTEEEKAIIESSV